MKKILFIFVILMNSILVGGRFPKKVSIISPGIKLGYAFGDSGGFTYGIEVSYIDGVSDRIWNYGAVISYDISRNYQKLHIGLEGFLYLGGIDFGPTLLINGEDTHYGYSITPFLGLIAYPYFSFSKFLNYEEGNIYEVGCYGKLPLIIKKTYEDNIIIHLENEQE